MFVSNKLAGFIMFVVTALLCGLAYADGETEVAAAVAEGAGAVSQTANTNPALFYAIGMTMGMGSLAAGIAVGKVGSAAMGAAAERPELLGKAIAFVGLGEGIALFGFLISLFLLFKI